MQVSLKGGVIQEVPITADMRRFVLGMAADIRRMIEHEAMPGPNRRRGRCTDCEYRRFCNDV